MAKTIEQKIETLNKRKPTHDNFKKIDLQLTSLGFKKQSSFYESSNGTASKVDDGGIWTKDNLTITTHYHITFESYTPTSLSLQISKANEKGNH